MALEQYDAMRKRAQQQINAQSQDNQDAINRRLAASGNLNSGAAIKQQQIAQDKSSQQLADTNTNIDVAEQGELQRRKEIQEGRDFTKSEREAGQGFVAGQSDLQRNFQQGQFDKEMDFKNKAQAFAESSFGKQMELQLAQFDHEKQNDEFNKNVAMSGMDDGELDSLGNDSAAFREQKASAKGRRMREEQDRERQQNADKKINIFGFRF